MMAHADQEDAVAVGFKKLYKYISKFLGKKCKKQVLYNFTCWLIVLIEYNVLSN